MDINNFRVSPIGDSLELWVEVPVGPAYNDITIKSIAIQDHKHYTVSYPTTPQVELTQDHPIAEFNISNPKKVIKRLMFKDMTTLGLNNTGMFFVYIKSDGIPGEQVKCICFKDVTVGVAANLYPLYNLAIKYLNTIDDLCINNSDKLIDIYLKKQLFLEALTMQEYSTAISIWDKIFFRDIKKGDCLNANSCNFNNFNGDSITIPFTSGCKTCN